VQTISTNYTHKNKAHPLRGEAANRCAQHTWRITLRVTPVAIVRIYACSAGDAAKKTTYSTGRAKYT